MRSAETQLLLSYSKWTTLKVQKHAFTNNEQTHKGIYNIILYNILR